jgi:pimeloyl-ACP methyl ester carboxylesterase
MMKYTKFIRRAAIVLSVLLPAGFGLVYYAAPYMILTPRKYNLSRTPADLELPYQKIEVKTADSLTLRGYWVHRPGDSGKTTIILLHGVGGCKEHWLPTAAWLWQEGYETVFVDGRAHGESDGRYCTYGFFEKHDVSAITDYVLLRKNGGPVGVWGNSLGGAIAVQALAMEPRLAFGIIQSTFADFRTIVYDYQQQRLKIPWRWFTDDGIARAVEMAHFEPDSIRPAESARHIRQPVLLAHGDADDRIKADYGRQIFANLASEQKELHIIRGAGHLNLMARGGETFKATLIRFLKQRH